MKNPGCLGYVRDYTTQLYRDYNKPIQGSLLTNQYNGKYEVFFVAQLNYQYQRRIKHCKDMVIHWAFCGGGNLMTSKNRLEILANRTVRVYVNLLFRAIFVALFSAPKNGT